MPETVVLEGGGLRAVFRWRGDRYGHTIERVRGDEARLLLESIEGNPEEDWPASPSLSQLHIERRADGRDVALLVGMAGDSHWSASVELESKRRRIIFDVACRFRSTPPVLGSAYRTWCDTRMDGAGTASLGTSDDIVLCTESLADSRPCLVTTDSHHVRITAPSWSGPPLGTVRWRYVVQGRRDAVHRLATLISAQ